MHTHKRLLLRTLTPVLRWYRQPAHPRYHRGNFLRNPQTANFYRLRSCPELISGRTPQCGWKDREQKGPLSVREAHYSTVDSSRELLRWDTGLKQYIPDFAQRADTVQLDTGASGQLPT
jgi:hypothetical protein